MVNDTTTFFLAFLTIFAALGFYMWRLEREVTRLERHVTDLESKR